MSLLSTPTPGNLFKAPEDASELLVAFPNKRFVFSCLLLVVVLLVLLGSFVRSGARGLLSYR